MGVGPELEPVPEIWTYIRQKELYVEKRTQGRVPTLDPDARTPAAWGVGGSSQGPRKGAPILGCDPVLPRRFLNPPRLNGKEQVGSVDGLRNQWRNMKAKSKIAEMLDRRNTGVAESPI